MEKVLSAGKCLVLLSAVFYGLIDNIATLLEDISVLSKVAVSKTAGVLGDDLARGEYLSEESVGTLLEEKA